MFYTYIIQSKKYNKYYIGSTSDIDKRLFEHNNDCTKSTKYKGPWILIYSEIFKTRSEAIIREKQIKKLKVEILLKN